MQAHVWATLAGPAPKVAARTSSSRGGLAAHGPGKRKRGLALCSHRPLKLSSLSLLLQEAWTLGDSIRNGEVIHEPFLRLGPKWIVGTARLS